MWNSIYDTNDLNVHYGYLLCPQMLGDEWQPRTELGDQWTDRILHHGKWSFDPSCWSAGVSRALLGINQPPCSKSASSFCLNISFAVFCGWKNVQHGNYRITPCGFSSWYFCISSPVSKVNFILFISIIRILIQKLRCPDVGGNDQSQYRCSSFN